MSRAARVRRALGLSPEFARRVRRSLPPWRPRWGNLRRLEPFSVHYGLDRGTPVDRWYIDRFVAERAHLVRGTTLEVKEPQYTARHGELVTRREIVDLFDDNPLATIVADIGVEGSLPAATFDCIVCTQVLQYVYDAEACVRNLWQALKPGGTLLLTVPALFRQDAAPGAEQVRYLATGLRSVLERAIGDQGTWTVEPKGNLLAVVAGLYELAHEELTEWELAHDDPLHPIAIVSEITKPGA